MNKKIIILILIILMIPAFFLYGDLHSMATSQDGEIGVKAGEIYLHNGGQKSTGYAMNTNGAGGELTYSDTDSYALIDLDLTNITFKSNIDMNEFNKDLRNNNIRYSVKFYDENGSYLTYYKVKMPTEKTMMDGELLSASYNVKEKNTKKTIEIIEDIRQSTLKINDTDLVIEDKQPRDFSVPDAMGAKYAIVELEVFGDNTFFNWKDYHYHITSGKIVDITSTT